MAAVPELVQRDAFAFQRGGSEFFRHNGVAAAYSRESGSLREAAELDGAFLRSLYLIDGVGHVVFADEGFVGGIEQNQRVVGERIVHPFLQLGLGQGGARGVVGVAEVDDVDALVRNLRDEVVLGGTRHVGDVAPLAVFLQYSGTSAHHVAVYIDRINRVGHAYAVVVAENVADVSRVALCSVVHEDFRRTEVDAAWKVIVLDDGFYQEVVSLLGTISTECPYVSHLLHCLVHRFDADRWQWPGNVSDTQTDDLLLGMCYPESIYLLGYV